MVVSTDLSGLLDWCGCTRHQIAPVDQQHCIASINVYVITNGTKLSRLCLISDSCAQLSIVFLLCRHPPVLVAAPLLPFVGRFIARRASGTRVK